MSIESTLSVEVPAPAAERTAPGREINPLIGWTRESVELRFAVGDVRLGAVDVPALVHRGYVARLDRTGERQAAANAATGVDASAAAGLLPRPWPDGVEAVLLRSQPVERELPTLVRDAGVLRYVPRHYRRCHIELQGTFEDYLGTFSSKSRSTLRRKVRKLDKHCEGDMRFDTYRGVAGMREFHRLAAELSERTYQALLLDAGLPTSEEFLRQMDDLARRDDVRGFLLSRDDRPIAYIFSRAEGDVLGYNWVGFDPDYAKWSPGTVLQYLVLERIFEDTRFRVFDFGEGDGYHKKFFATDKVLCADLHFFRDTVRNRALLGAHRGLARAAEAAAGRLEALGLKKRLKNLLRRR